jgi:transglutaminase-like putative cysteine protease
MKVSVKSLIGVSILAAALLALPAGAATVTLKELRTAPHLTPEKFAAYFADFEFKFHAEVQDPNVFLKTKSGDCDDYATVAGEVLSASGYTPRLIAVRMKGETHVVCYIEEVGGYLDYNCRKDANKIVPCSPKLTDIARKVADSFGHDWVATYEFTFDSHERVKRLVDRIVSNRTDFRQTASVADSSAAAQKEQHEKH